MPYCHALIVLSFLALACALDQSGLQDETSFLQTYPRPLHQKGALAADSCTESVVGVNLLHSPTADKYFWMNKNGDHICSGASKDTGPSNISAGPSWSFKAEAWDMLMSNPLIDDKENVYLCTREVDCYKFNSKGEQLWKFTSTLDGTFHISPAIMDGNLYLGQGGNALAVDMETGELVWHTEVAPKAAMDLPSIGVYSGVMLMTVISSDADVDYQKTGDDTIVALNASSGKVMWTRRINKMYNNMFTFVENPPSVISSDCFGSPFRLQLCDGQLLWQAEKLPRSVFTTGAAIVHEGLGFVFATSNYGDDDGDPFGVVAGTQWEVEGGRLTAYHIGSGQLAWQREFSLSAGAGPAMGNLGGGHAISVVVALGEVPNPFAIPDNGTYEYPGELRAVDAITGEDTGWSWSPPVWRKQFAEGELGATATMEVMGYPACGPDHWTNPVIDGNGTVFAGHVSGHLFAVHDLDGDGKINEAAGEVSKWYAGRCFQAPVAISKSMLIGTSCGGMHVF